MLVFVSCKKDNNQNSDYEGNPTSYLVEQIAIEHSGSQDNILYFRYNENNLVSEIRRSMWADVTYGNAAPVRQESIMTYSFEYVNQLPVKILHAQGRVKWTFNYVFHANLPTKQTILHNDQVFQDSTLFYYDLDRRLMSSLVYREQADSKRDLFYSNDIISVINYYYNQNPQRKTKTVYSGFDNKVNFCRAINGLPVILRDHVLTGMFSVTAAPGNYTRVHRFDQVDINESFDTFRGAEYTYEYNEAGLPTKITNAGGTIQTITYRKYR